MSLRKKQSEFVKNIGKLIEYSYGQGYELTFGDAYRDPRVHGEFGVSKSYSAASSVHKLKLAIDLNLFVSGARISTSHPAWHDLGAYWKSLSSDARWGGDFKIKDFNHFSYAENGYM